jgi:hypothetical protein
MSRTGKWRFLLADASGAVLNSKTLGPPKRPQPEASKGSGPEATRSAQPTPEGEPERPASAFFGNEVKGGFIVGVASTSPRKSIRVFNGRTRYDEWEFIGLAAPGTAPAGTPPQGQQPSSGAPGTGQQGPLDRPLPPLTDSPIPKQ